jgi:hypothetical protein
MDEIGKRILWIVVYVFVAVALVPELAEQAGRNWVRGKVDACVDVMVGLYPGLEDRQRQALAVKALGQCP